MRHNQHTITFLKGKQCSFPKSSSHYLLVLSSAAKQTFTAGTILSHQNGSTRLWTSRRHSVSGIIDLAKSFKIKGCVNISFKFFMTS